MENSVYIVGVQSIFPTQYDSAEVIDRLYSEKLTSPKVNKFAKRLSKNILIQHRAISIDLEEYPQKVIREENSPVSWATTVWNGLVRGVEKPAPQFLSVSYNSSSHSKVMPNLACQIAHACNLPLIYPPQEIVHYGCASGIFSIQAAFDKAKERSMMGYVFAFEQSSWVFKPLYDENDPNFKASLRTHSIFGDGGAGVLIASGEAAEQFDAKVKIIDIETGFEYGDVIDMSDGYFFTRDGVRDRMPELISSRIIKPLLSRNGLEVKQIREWSMHQGGLPVIETFMDDTILGLSEEQIALSKRMFLEHGNISTPSNFVVFEQQFHSADAVAGEYGMIVGFGAGYYLGALLYQRC